jgi:tartrate-resistant acid phosphatase type 5
MRNSSHQVRARCAARRKSSRRHPIEQLETRALLAANQYAAFGDFGHNSVEEAAVSKMVHDWQPDGILALGDNNYVGRTAAGYDLVVGKFYHDFIGNYTGTFGPGAAANKLWPTLGNHDYENDPTAAAYRAYFTLPGNERFYEKVLGDLHIFVINSEPEELTGNMPTSAQAMWLKKVLAASTSLYNVVYDHRPPYSSSPSHGSQLNMRWPYKEWGADVVLSGHVHNYERLVEGGLT